MPSGAKKRKAAKKKKEKQCTNTSASVTQGDDELKHHHDEKDSEGEEEDVEKREDGSSKSEDGVNDEEKVGSEEKSVLGNERDVKPEGESKSREVKVESAERESSSSSSSSSSSDDESDKKKTVVVETAELVSEVSDNVQVPEVVETASVIDFDKGSFLEQAVSVIENDYLKPSDAVELGSKDKGEKPPLEEVCTEVSTGLMNLGSRTAENEVTSTSEEKAAESSDATGFTQQETSNGSAHVKYSEYLESSDNQPLIGSAPRPVRRISWKSCCGLFEVFSGSNR